MIHDFKPVEAICGRVATEQQLVSDLENQIKDSGIRDLRVARNFLGDVEPIFLGRLTQEYRTGHEEALLLSGAELALQMAAHYRKLVQDTFKKFRSDAISLG